MYSTLPVEEKTTFFQDLAIEILFKQFQIVQDQRSSMKEAVIRIR